MTDIRVRGVPWLAWVFIALAVAEALRVVLDVAPGSTITLPFLVVFVLGLIPAVASILLPAALLIRHPNVWRVAPTLLFGTILVAAVQGLQVLADPLQPLFETLTPASEEIPDFVPLAAMFDLLTFLVLVFGLAYISLALSKARRIEDSPGWITSLFVPMATTLATVAGVIEISRLDVPFESMSPVLVFYIGSAFVPGILQAGIWAYLLSITTRGWRAGEAPSTGWGLGVLGAASILLAFGLIYVVRIFELQDSLGDLYLYAVSLAYALGYLSLLAAFAAGLPEIDEDEDDDEDGEETDDDEAGGELLDENGWPIAT